MAVIDHITNNSGTTWIRKIEDSNRYSHGIILLAGPLVALDIEDYTTTYPR
jgi:hypothetical protein